MRWVIKDSITGKYLAMRQGNVCWIDQKRSCHAGSLLIYDDGEIDLDAQIQDTNRKYHCRWEKEAFE